MIQASQLVLLFITYYYMLILRIREERLDGWKSSNVCNVVMAETRRGCVGGVYRRQPSYGGCLGG